MPQLKLREMGFGVGAVHEGIDRVITLCYRQQRPKLSLLLSYYRVRAVVRLDNVVYVQSCVWIVLFRICLLSPKGRLT